MLFAILFQPKPRNIFHSNISICLWWNNIDKRPGRRILLYDNVSAYIAVVRSRVNRSQNIPLANHLHCTNTRHVCILISCLCFLLFNYFIGPVGILSLILVLLIIPFLHTCLTVEVHLWCVLDRVITRRLWYSCAILTVRRFETLLTPRVYTLYV